MLPDWIPIYSHTYRHFYVCMLLGTNETKNTSFLWFLWVPSSNLTAQETGNCCQNGVSSGHGQQGDQRTGSVWETSRPSSNIKCAEMFWDILLLARPQCPSTEGGIELDNIMYFLALHSLAKYNCFQGKSWYRYSCSFIHLANIYWVFTMCLIKNLYP